MFPGEHLRVAHRVDAELTDPAETLDRVHLALHKSAAWVEFMEAPIG
jgi:hypothetical protein